MGPDAFLDRFAASGRYRYGRPAQFTVSPDGQRVVFLRAPGGLDPAAQLLVLDLASGQERVVADAAGLLAGQEDDVPVAERARRERARESGGGIAGYATNRDVTLAVFALSGRVWMADLLTGATTEVPVAGPAIDPRLDPAGQRVGYVTNGEFWVTELGGTGLNDTGLNGTELNDTELNGTGRRLAGPEGPEVSYGLAEHVAAEEMGRSRGFWWAPDGQRVLVARVDETAVQHWYIADPANPQNPPRAMAFPQAGTANADVTLWLLGLDGSRTEVTWDRAALEYLVEVDWRATPRIVVQSRDQQLLQVRVIDEETGQTQPQREQRDPCWVALPPGLPATTGSGQEVWIAADGETYRLTVGGEPVTPAGLQVSEVLSVDGDSVLFAASAEPSEQHVWAWDGTDLTRLTTEPGVHTGVRAGGVMVLTAQSLAHEGVQVRVLRDGAKLATIGSRAEPFGLDLRIQLIKAGPRELRTAVLLPSWHTPGSGQLPVLLDPYGGPGGKLAVNARGWWFGISQWFAEQGFAVVVSDGSGTQGRGPAWEREVYLDIATSVLDDQVAALQAAAARYPDLDLSKVAIRGWSYGGYLATLAVLRRPDVFHAAVAGAAIFDQHLYDTYWKERFLGHPDDHPDAYAKCSLINEAASLTRPLMLIQGLADDNVFPANTLRFSSALLAAGRPHTFVPLSGVTHMPTDSRVVANLHRLQVHFLRQALDLD
jgi:dipeptidyl-peptidase-4